MEQEKSNLRQQQVESHWISERGGRVCDGPKGTSEFVCGVKCLPEIRSKRTSQLLEEIAQLPPINKRLTEKSKQPAA